MATQLFLRSPALACTAKQHLLRSTNLAASKLTVRPASDDANKPNKGGILSRLMGPESAVGSASTNRWAMFLPAFATHVCLGAPYGWSAISAQLSRESGVVASSSADWALDACSYPMSVMIAAGGLSAAIFGKWTMKVGVRRAMATGGSLFGAGFLLTSLGVLQHNLPLVYAGNRTF